MITKKMLLATLKNTLALAEQAHEYAEEATPTAVACINHAHLVITRAESENEIIAGATSYDDASPLG